MEGLRPLLLSHMNPEIKQLWLDALPHYKKCSGALRRKNRHCVLGVLCDLYAQRHSEARWEQRGYGWLFCIDDDSTDPTTTRTIPPRAVLKWAELPFDDGALLAMLNDIRGYTFKQLADYIRKNLPPVPTTHS